MLCSKSSQCLAFRDLQAMNFFFLKIFTAVLKPLVTLYCLDNAF